MDFRHVSKGLSQVNKPHKNRSKSGGKVEVRQEAKTTIFLFSILSMGAYRTTFIDKIIHDHWTRQ